MESSKVVLWLLVVLSLIFTCDCQTSTMAMNVAEMKNDDSFSFVCNISSSRNLTRWTFQNTTLPGSTKTSLMRFQNNVCTVSPNDSFISNEQVYLYACNNTVYQINIYYSTQLTHSIHNHILACRDAFGLEGRGSTWFILIHQDTTCKYCKPTMSFNVNDVTEGDNATLIYRVSSNVTYVNWKFGSNTAAMGVLNKQCTTQGTTFLDKKSKYSYTCNQKEYQVTTLNVQRSEHNDMYMSFPSGQTEGTGSNWIIKVKAKVTSVKLTPSNDQVNVTENTAEQFKCTTSTARPAASVYWYIHSNENNNVVTITENITTTTDYNDLSVITSTLNFVPTRQHNGMKIYCEANNSIATSPVKSIKIGLNVPYRTENAYIVQGREYREIDNTQGKLTCSVKGGNPTPTLSWSCNKFSPINQSTINSKGNVTTTLTWNVSRNHSGTCTCIPQQIGFIHEAVFVSLIVLYPPTKPRFKVNEKGIDGNISFIEGTTRSITCAADSKPSPDSYTWTGPSIAESLNNSKLTLNTIVRASAGEYKCSVHNTMNLSDGGPVKRSNNSTVKLVVLYPPVALPINNTSILIGTNLTIRCPYIAGMPIATRFVWTRNIDDKQWNGEQLNISHVEKSDAANYSCNVSNVMMPSGESISYIGHDTQSFFLEVLYKANVTSFTIGGIASTTVTKNESEPVQFACNADSNPTATITLSHDNKSLKTEISNIVKHDIFRAGCLDAGKYMCYARNEYNTMLSVSEEVQLFVNCYPRTATEIKGNITSEKNATVTITLNVIAYPPPTFIWYKKVEEEWTLLNDNDNYSLSSSADQSNLTIIRVESSDFTGYKVQTKNEFGKMDQLYYLSPYDKPDTPINFTHIESRTTTSSIHLVWTPGFDNGPPQTFNIKYKKISDNVWNYRNVSDNGESTMEIQLTGLTENTQYECVIFASNEKGNSSALSLTAATLKFIENSPTNPAPVIGGIAGGVTGCSIIVIVIIIIIRRYPLCKVCSEKLSRGKSDKINNRADEHDYYNTGRSEEITNQDNNDKTYNTIESDASRNDKSTEDVAYYNVANVSEYEMISRNNIEPTPYSTLDQTELGTRSDANNDDKKAVYENLKLQVF